VIADHQDGAVRGQQAEPSDLRRAYLAWTVGKRQQSGVADIRGNLFVPKPSTDADCQRRCMRFSRLKVCECLLEHRTMVLLPLHRQPEARHRVRSSVRLRLADEARVHLLDLVILAVS
jgi:hypothetical protein